MGFLNPQYGFTMGEMYRMMKKLIQKLSIFLLSTVCVALFASCVVEPQDSSSSSTPSSVSTSGESSGDNEIPQDSSSSSTPSSADTSGESSGDNETSQDSSSSSTPPSVDTSGESIGNGGTEEDENELPRVPC